MSIDADISVNIRAIAFGGDGIGEVVSQHDGRSDLLGISAFVPFAAPGEVVSARIIERKDRYLKAQLLSIITPANERVAPPCRFFTSCGGCELQHISYREQLEAKYQMVLGQLKAAKLTSTQLDTLRSVVPGEEYAYRRRITLHVDAVGRVGFYRESSRSVVAIDSCTVAVPMINELLFNIQDLGRQIQGKITSILLEADSGGVVAVLKSPYALAPTEVQSVLGIAKKFFDNVILQVADKEIMGFGRQILELPLTDTGTPTIRVPAGYFSQVNSPINTQLIARTLEIAELRAGEKVFDLYAGAGNFSIPFARAGGRVTAVECDKRLVNLGRENTTRYGLQKSLDFIEASVEKFLDSAYAKQGADIVLADPPRSGLGNLVSELPPASRLVYISCHLPSFARDIRALFEQGWEVRTMIPFDMFAQTSYVELLALFTKQDR